MKDTGLSQLQHRIDTLLAHAQENEAIQQRVHQLELALIASSGLGEYLQQLLTAMPVAFALDAVSLHLHDAEHTIRHLIEAEGITVAPPDALQFHEDLCGLDSFACNDSAPQLQPYDEAGHRRLFNLPSPALGSVALLPLHRGDRLLGLLVLGSEDAGRFVPEHATDFLRHLAAIAAVCLENAINHERLRHLGLTDALTGVRNRRYFEQRLLDECHALKRHGRPLACLFLDLDHFKQINDQYGHHHGDHVLQRAAARINRQLRDNDLLSRYGGEEFVVLLPDTNVDIAMGIAERIRAALANRGVELADGTPLAVTLSVGVAIVEGGTDVEAGVLAARLVESADNALYRAKETGRNRVSEPVILRHAKAD